MRWTLLIGMVWAGTTGVPAQTGFITQLDSAQNGKPGSGRSVFEVSDGYLIFGHQISHDGTGKTHLFVRKLDSLGRFVHQREYSYGDPRHYNFGPSAGVCRIDTGGFASVVLEGSAFTSESWLYRFDENGDTTSRKHLLTFDPSDSVYHFLWQTRQTSDGGFICAGWYEWFPVKTEGYLLRLNSQGDTLWTKRFGNFNVESTQAAACTPYPDGGVLLVGWRTMGFVQDSQFLIRTDSMGGQLWRRQFGEDASGVYAVVVCADSTIVTAGEYREVYWPNYWQQVMLTKWSPQGNIVWQKRSHYQYTGWPADLEVLPSGSYVACIRMGPAVTNIAKFSAVGDSTWSRSYSVFIDSHYPQDISLTTDGGFLTTGFVYQDNTGGHPGLQTTYVIKTDSLGCVVPGCHLVGVQEYAIELQEHLKLWPNPATDHLRLELELPEGAAVQGAVQAVLLDATGRAVLRERVRRNGNLLSHALTLSLFPPGLYHLHLADEKRWLAGGRVVVSAP